MPKVGGASSRFVPIPNDTILHVRVLSVQEVEKPVRRDGNESIQDRYEFTFKILRVIELGYTEGCDTKAEELVGRKIRQDTPTTFTNNEKCKLHNWAEKITGRSIDAETEEFELNELVNMTCRLVMSGNRKPRADGDGYWYNSWVDRVLTDQSAVREGASTGGGSGGSSGGSSSQSQQDRWGDKPNDEEPF